MASTTLTAPRDARERERAIDIARSVIVKAPAGSGKTSLLVERYLKLLAAVEEPEAILAITFTRKAALEMRERVLARLDEHSDLSARVRDWDLATRPDRLKIQTIDSFSLQLANAMPMTSGVASTRPTDNPLPLYQEAVDRLLLRVVHDDPLASTIADFLATLENDVASARRFLIDALTRRDQWQMVVADIASAVNRVRDSIRRGVGHLRASAESQFEGLLEASLRDDIVAVVDGLDAGDSRWPSAAKILLTKDGTPRKRFDKRGGFGPGQTTLRERASRATAQLAESDLAAPLARMADLPQFMEQRSLEPIAIVLSLALVELGDVFRRRGLSDFTELTVRANQALGADDLPSELALALDYRIRHLLVDEFQDTSVAQFRLLTKLTEGWTPGDGNSFFAVGDPMQSIYRFRDAEVRLYLDTYSNGLPNRELTSLELSSNFRSSKPLVDWVNEICRSIFSRHEDPIVGGVPFAPADPIVDDDGGANVDIVLGESATRVANRILAIRADDPHASIAILVRTRATLGPILAALRDNDILHRGTEIESLSESPVVRDLFALTRVLYDPGDRLSCLALLRSPLIGLTSREIERANQALADFVPIRDLDLGLVAGDRRQERLRAALDLRPRSTPPRTRVEEAWLELGGSEAYATSAGAERFFELLDDELDLIDRPNELARRLDDLMNTDSGSRDPSAVDVMTIHRSKGLEFDHVIVPSLEATTRDTPRPMLLWRAEGDDFLIACKERNPRNALYEWLVREEREKDRNETKRLIYVALTRARRSLTLIGSLEDRDAKPPRGSMLELLWPAIANEVRYIQAEPALKVTRQVLNRLPLAYVWQPPRRAPLAPRPANPVARPSSGAMLDQWIRREFATITRTGAAPSSADRLPIWRIWEKETLETHPSLLDALARHRDATLDSKDGRRVLLTGSATAAAAHSGNFVVDRVLDGCRITFDTSDFSAFPDLEAAVTARVGDYTNAGDDRHASDGKRFGILFTSLGRLVEVAI